MIKFNNYRDYRQACIDLGLDIRADADEKNRFYYGMITGPQGTVLIGSFDQTRKVGVLYEGRIEIAKRGLRPGDVARIEHFDDDDNVYSATYLIARTLKTRTYDDVPVDIRGHRIHYKQADCFECKAVLGGRVRIFRVKDCDPA
jgi:hypothetical protein